MWSVYLASSSSASMDWIGLAVVMAVVAVLGAFGSPRSRKFVLVLAIVLVLAYSTRALAQPYSIPCDPIWKWLGWC